MEAALFIDASAIVSIMTGKVDAAELKRALLMGKPRLTSAVAVYEATLAVARKANGDVQTAERDLGDLLRSAQITIVPIGPEEARLALEAHGRFGKGRPPAGLNMGDCFAYACGKAHGAALLFKGDDFALTDVEAG